MSKKRVKNRNKKRDHNKISNRLMLLRAAKCPLFRWGHTPDNALIPQKPKSLSEAQMHECVSWALDNYHHWIVDVYGCFLTPEGDYYEEMATIDTMEAFGHQIRLRSEDLVWELESEARSHVKSEGNEKHYLDTVTICRLRTDKVLALLENDKWLKEQAAHRAGIITKELL